MKPSRTSLRSIHRAPALLVGVVALSVTIACNRDAEIVTSTAPPLDPGEARTLTAKRAPASEELQPGQAVLLGSAFRGV